LGWPEQAGSEAAPPATVDANEENCFVSFVEPQFGHWAPFQLVERTRISESAPHLPQWNS
jgi:hypothetical protein